MTDQYYLRKVVEDERGEHHNIRLPLQLTEEPLAEIAVEGDMVSIVMVLILAGGIHMYIIYRRWVNAKYKTRPIFVVHMMQVDEWIELGDSRYLN